MTKPRQDGYVLLLTLIQGLVFLTILTGVLQLAFANWSSARNSQAGLQALAAAEAGGDAAMKDINVASNDGLIYPGTTPPVSNVCALATNATSGAGAVTLYDDTIKGRATYETCVQENSVENLNGGEQDRHERVIYSVGKVYLPRTASRPTQVRRVKLVAVGSPSGNYSVRTGPGGLVMENSATVANGNVFVGGYLHMSSSAQIGSLASPAEVKVANYNCPKTAPYTGYPQLCSSGNSITIENVAHIYGSVTANGQTNTSGMSDPGLVASYGAPAVSMPEYDREGHKAAVTSTLSAAQAGCGNSGNVTWPANVHITGGNLTLDKNCTVTVLGNVWIDGSVIMTQKAIIRAGSGLTELPVVMIDGSTGLALRNQSSIASNENNIGLRFITFYSTSSCNPNCQTVTGADLKSSEDVKTIELNNQGLGGGSQFYARWSKLVLSNGGDIGSILAQKVVLENSGNITFSGDPSGVSYAWSVRYYEQLPVPDSRTTN